MRNITAGPGDSCTWGPITSSADPRAETQEITFTANIGMASVEVEVTAEVWTHGPLHCIGAVMLGGVDISGALTDEQTQELEKAAQAHMEVAA